jgi:acetolactate synthase I/II/III large subunit
VFYGGGGLINSGAYDGPFFLDVSVAAQANCFPMIPSGRGHHEPGADTMR